jgi:hypothetical protein
MAKRDDVDPVKVLTPVEEESVRFAQELYGAHAKLAGAEVLDVLEVEPEARARVIGAIGIKLEELDFEARRQVWLKFKELAAILGGTAVMPNLSSEELAVLVLPAEIPAELRLALAPDEEGDTALSHGGNPDSIERPRPRGRRSSQPATEGRIELHDDIETPVPPAPEPAVESQQEKKVPLSDQQKWLKGLFRDEGAIKNIEAMTPAQREYLIQRLGQRLDPILRPQWKDMTRDRVATVEQFLNGMVLEEIAEERHMTIKEVREILNHARDRLKNRTRHEDLLSLVAEAQRFI